MAGVPVVATTHVLQAKRGDSPWSHCISALICTQRFFRDVRCYPAASAVGGAISTNGRRLCGVSRSVSVGCSGIARLIAHSVEAAHRRRPGVRDDPVARRPGDDARKATTEYLGASYFLSSATHKVSKRNIQYILFVFNVLTAKTIPQCSYTEQWRF